MNRGNCGLNDEEEESIESETDAQGEEDFTTPIEDIPQVQNNHLFEEDNSSDNNDSEDESVPGLQDRDAEDSSDDDDEDDDSSKKTDNNIIGETNVHRTLFGNYKTDYDDIKSIYSDSDDESYGRIGFRQQQDKDDDEHDDGFKIPNLICRIDNDDSSDDDDDDDDDDNTVEHHGNNSTSNNNIDEELVDAYDIEYNDDDLYFQSSDDEHISTETRSKEIESDSAQHFVLNDLDETEAESIGGKMDIPKSPGMIRISGCNPNGIQAEQLKSHLQHSLDLGIDIQCYSEVNTDFLKIDQRQKFYEYTKSMNNQSRAVWGSSQVIVENNFKPGGTAIISQGKTAGRVKKSGIDAMGRWTYQLLDGQGDKDILIVSAYQCCKQPTNPVGITAYHQQEIMLSETDRVDRDPRRNFYRDLKSFIDHFLTDDEDKTVIPILVGDWNEECKGTSTTQKLCDDFGLVNIFDRLYPDQKQFKTYLRGSRTIDFALAPPEIADKVTNFVYEPFLYRLKGDHRAFYFDINENVLFGNKQPPPFDPEGRSFKSKDPKAVTKYLTAVHKHLQSNNVLNRISNMLKSDVPNHEEAEAIDAEITRACQHGANQCKKRRMDYWSIEIHELKRNLSVWCQFRSRKKRKFLSTALIARTRDIGLHLSESMTPLEIDAIIETIRKDVREVHKKSAERRDMMLLELANFAEDMEEPKKAKALRQMKRVERNTRVFNKYRFQRGKTISGGGISRLQVPTSWPSVENYDDDIDYVLEDPKKVDKQKDPSNWKEVNCPKEIEFLLRLRNQRHFGQAETDSTPFTTERMKHKFNWNASTEEAELVLEGNFTDNEMSEIERLFLDNMTRVTDTDDKTKFVTRKDFEGKFRAWRESTSTSPSGRHLGHYKATTATIDKTLLPEERTALRAIQEDIQDCYICIINYSIKHKYSFKRWKIIVNMMIYKEEGNVKIHRLRVIHLYEADLGFLWGAKWGKAMKDAVKDKKLHQGQYGGLPGRDCTSLTYLEELRLDYSLLTRYSFANFDNDATACYDRILCSIASLAGRKYGIHKDIIFVHANTLEEAEFKLKTSTKISDTSYRHCIKFPIHGTGQGSTNSPTIWCFISSVLFQSHNEKAHGILFESPDGEMMVRFNMVGFVDDSTCITGVGKNATLQELLTNMQADAQLWHDLLWCSGGKLELPKCGYHVIHYNFDNSGIPRMQHSPGDSITLNNEHGDEVIIKSKNIFQTRLNLGHSKSPAGNGNTEFERTMAKAVSGSDAITKCGGTRTETRLLYNAVWKPSVEYVLPQSFLSEKQLRTIEKASMPKLYAKCGFNRNTSRAVLAGPIELAGGGFTPLHVTAGTGYVTHFLKNWRTPDEDIGKQLRIVYAWTSYQAGVSFPLLERPEVELDYVQGRAIPAMRQYLSSIDGTITLNNKYIQPKLRKNDQCIMERVSTMNFTKNQRERINCVRMYIGIMYLSEICNVAGDQIRPRIDSGNHDQTYYTSTLKQPKQQRPNDSSFKLWRDVLNTFTTTNRVLKHKLGMWTKHHSTSGRWHAYQDINDQIFKYIHNKDDDHHYWESFTRHGTKLQLEDELDFDMYSPHNSIPIQINSFANRSHYTDQNVVVEHPTRCPYQHNPEVSWDKYIQQQPEWVKALLVQVEFYSSDDGDANLFDITAEHEKHGHLIAVSDGSVMFHNMSFGWILSTPDGVRLVGAAGPCNGRGNSLRAEGAGMLSVTLFLAILTKYLKMTSLNVVCIADNAELIRRCNAHKQYKEPYPNETLRSEFDVTEQIYKTQTEYNINATFKWVKGHQDKKIRKDDLPLEAQLNIEADELAGAYQQTNGIFRPLVHLLPSCPAMLAIRGISITSNYRKQLIRAYVEPAYIQYLQYRFEWSDSTIQTIAWKCLSLAIQRIRRDVLVTKVCNELLPTAATLYKRNYQNHDTCILCHHQETIEHMLRCESPTRIKWRIQFMCALRKRLEYLETEFSIGETLCTAISEWLETGIVIIDNYPPRFHAALATQTTIGWRHLFAGRLSQEWLQIQNITRPRTEERQNDSYIWGASIVEVTLSQYIKLWELRNEEVHGKTAEQQEQTRKSKLAVEVRKLDTWKNESRPEDMCLFHANIEEYIDTSTASTLATYISSHRKAIMHSVTVWAKSSHSRVTSILSWIRKTNSTEVVERIHNRKRTQLLATNGKRRRVRSQSTGRQGSIVGFLSLLQN